MNKRRTRPLYRQIADRIWTEFGEGQAMGHRLPTERDLERMLEVSSVTIRSALNALEATGRIDRRQGSGTFVRRQKNFQKHVALLLEGDIADPLLSPFYPRLLQEVRVAFLKKGIPTRPYLGYLRLGLEIGELTCQEIFDELKSERISGIVSLYAKSDPSWKKEPSKWEIPVIGETGGADYTVSVDLKKAAATLIRHLHTRKRQKVALIKLRNKGVSVFTSEFQKQAMATGISVDCHQVSYFSTSRQQEDWNQIHPALKKNDALIIEDDMLFSGVLQAFPEAAPFPPEDLIVRTSDAVSLSSPYPYLRLIYSVQTKAYLIAQAMERKLEGIEIPSFIEVPFRLEKGSPTKSAHLPGIRASSVH